MSGIVGIFNLNGAPVEERLLRSMTEFLAFRGPDFQATWIDGPIGFGHTMLRTTREAEHEHQPANLREDLWITADARIDAREDLIHQLRAKDIQVSGNVPDSTLILHAYDTWGEACIEHLLGDFAFAIWDARARRLFCARDHFGVKPFYYASFANCLIFSNTLDCLRTHPQVSDHLNDLAIADFLIFDYNQDPSTTSFTDIQRLPNSHALRCEADRISVRRYWKLSITTPAHYTTSNEYVEHFREIFDAAVADRLRTSHACVLMSGGLDSPTVAASARGILTRRGDGSGLSAYTEVYENLIPHEERYYANLVADALKIPIQYMLCDDYRLFGNADQSGNGGPEPSHVAWPDATSDELRQVGLKHRVALTGFGGDPTFASLLSRHFRQLFKQWKFGRALADAARYFSAEGRLSRLYFGARWRRWFPSKTENSWYPGWMNEDLEKRLDLRERWNTLSRGTACPEAVRPEASAALGAQFWQSLFEGYDSGWTRVPVEVCHPFFDLRLVNFLLALPTLPWCSDKELLREAFRGVLPDAVRLRRKSPLLADPLLRVLQRPEAEKADQFEPVARLEHYVHRNRVPPVFREKDAWSAWINLRPLSLNDWLQGPAWNRKH
jgi:asparagine synthase (glutamine-hydrolysing)